VEAPARPARRPDWLKIRLRTDDSFRRMRSMVAELRLNTVCTEARCPNIYECWNAGTATFMILGEVCTRRCGFCSVTSGRPRPGVDPDEPHHVAEAVARLGLAHAVITSVDRDDLPDGGARHFHDVIRAIRERNPQCAVEVLTPDFKNKPGALGTVLAAACTARLGPDRATARRSGCSPPRRPGVARGARNCGSSRA
jgi:lipoic acid synthetase